ncbi:MAG: molecular chaperone TorD family protein [Myxococcota bacterium]
MSLAKNTLAWRRAHALLGALLVEGLDGPRLEAVRAVPELAQPLPEGADLDALAAEHYALLGRELPPLAGVFLDHGGLVGDSVCATVVRQAYAAMGVDCPDDPGPDHLGQALLLMAMLADAELGAGARDDTANVRALQGWQRRLLDEALLPWMPPLYAALREQPTSLWTGVLAMAIGVLARQRAVDPSLPWAGRSPGAGSDSLEGLLDDPRTDLRRVAEVLTTPARCGVYLAPRDIEGLARRCALPQGFGGRRDRLEKTLRAAAEYDAIPLLVEQLQHVLHARDGIYAALGQEPGLAVHVGAWRRRVTATRRLLDRLGDAAHRVLDDVDR